MSFIIFERLYITGDNTPDLLITGDHIVQAWEQAYDPSAVYLEEIVGWDESADAITELAPNLVGPGSYVLYENKAPRTLSVKLSFADDEIGGNDDLDMVHVLADLRAREMTKELCYIQRVVSRTSFDNREYIQGKVQKITPSVRDRTITVEFLCPNPLITVVAGGVTGDGRL